MYESKCLVLYTDKTKNCEDFNFRLEIFVFLNSFIISVYHNVNPVSQTRRQYGELSTGPARG